MKAKKNTTPLKACIIIPAWNEEAAIDSVVDNVINAFRQTIYTTTVLVVDDGSKDNTAEVAEKAGAVVVRHIMNTGAGGATATGLCYAERNGFTIAATMDADGQHHPKDVVRGLDELTKRHIDLLIGSRLINSKGMSRVKILGNRGLSLVTFLLFGINSTDSQSGLRIFSRKALEQLRWRNHGYEFCSEMLWRAKQQKLTIGEYPIEAIYTEYSVSKMGQNNWNGVNIVKSLLKRRIVELFE